VAFSPDGRILASASKDTTVKLWDTATGKLLRTLTGHTEEVWSVAFSPPNGRMVASGAGDSIRFWDPASGKLLRTLPGTGVIAFGRMAKSSLSKRKTASACGT